MSEHVRELDYKILGQNILLIQGVVDVAMARFVLEAVGTLDARGSPDVEVRITSPGGDVSIGLDIYDMLRRYRGKKTGVVYGYARSMGAIILQACEHRVGLKNSEILIHHPTAREVSLSVLRDRAKLRKLKADMEEQQAHLLAIVTARTGKSSVQIEAVCAKDTAVRAEDALALGLIDEIF